MGDSLVYILFVEWGGGGRKKIFQLPAVFHWKTRFSAYHKFFVYLPLGKKKKHAILSSPKKKNGKAREENNSPEQ